MNMTFRILVGPLAAALIAGLGAVPASHAAVGPGNAEAAVGQASSPSVEIRSADQPTFGIIKTAAFPSTKLNPKTQRPLFPTMLPTSGFRLVTSVDSPEARCMAEANSKHGVAVNVVDVLPIDEPAGRRFATTPPGAWNLRLKLEIQIVAASHREHMAVIVCSKTGSILQIQDGWDMTSLPDLSQWKNVWASTLTIGICGIGAERNVSDPKKCAGSLLVTRGPGTLWENDASFQKAKADQVFYGPCYASDDNNNPLTGMGAKHSRMSIQWLASGGSVLAESDWRRLVKDPEYNDGETGIVSPAKTLENCLGSQTAGGDIQNEFRNSCRDYARSATSEIFATYARQTAGGLVRGVMATVPTRGIDQKLAKWSADRYVANMFNDKTQSIAVIETPDRKWPVVSKSGSFTYTQSQKDAMNWLFKVLGKAPTPLLKLLMTFFEGMVKGFINWQDNAVAVHMNGQAVGCGLVDPLFASRGN